MASYYDEDLHRLHQETLEKKGIEAMLSDLQIQKEELEKKSKDLEKSMNEEQEDVERLNKGSLTAFFYRVSGKLEEKLTGEQILYQLNLYRKYMSEQMAEGKTEAQVLQKLGDPTVVAQKVMEAYENKEKQEAAQRGNALKDPFPLTAEEMNAQIKNGMGISSAV